MTERGNYLGSMYIAKRPCGKVCAMIWDDAGREKSTAKTVASWIARGDVVERLERYEHDEMPEWSCRGGCPTCPTPKEKV